MNGTSHGMGAGTGDWHNLLLILQTPTMPVPRAQAGPSPEGCDPEQPGAGCHIPMEMSSLGAPPSQEVALNPPKQGETYTGNKIPTETRYMWHFPMFKAGITDQYPGCAKEALRTRYTWTCTGSSHPTTPAELQPLQTSLAKLSPAPQGFPRDLSREPCQLGKKPSLQFRSSV